MHACMHLETKGECMHASSRDSRDTIHACVYNIP